MDGPDTPSVPVLKTPSGSADRSWTLPEEPLRARDAPHPAAQILPAPLGVPVPAHSLPPRGSRAAGTHHAAQLCSGPGRNLLGCGGILGTPRPPRAGLWQLGQEFPDRELAARGGRAHARAPAPAPRAGSRVSAAAAAACQPGAAQAVPGRALRGALGLPDGPWPGSSGARQCLPALSPSALQTFSSERLATLLCVLRWVLQAPCLPHSFFKRRTRAASADPGLKCQSSKGDFKKSCVLRGPEKGPGENVSEAEIHQQNRPKETRCQLGTEGVTGEDLVPEQKDEVAEFQRKGSALQPVPPGSEPSRRQAGPACCGLPCSVCFHMGSLPATRQSQLEGELSGTHRKTDPGESWAARSKSAPRGLVFVS